ncbi:MAG: DUF4129 domain-containing protein [Chloroflexi bacterium]|nr:DUF4129 domain-containing protein [Chloroflexota bacterium]MCI0646692.1 DUF4129 domain-containing protein [Chloroflexota bacterium]
MSWIRWHWLNDGVLTLAMITLRLCWLWLWLGLVRRWLIPSYQGPLLPAWLMVGLLLGSLVVTRWVSRRSREGMRARLVLAGLGLAVMFLIFWGQFYRLHYPLWDWRWLNQWGQGMLFWVGEPPPSYLALPAIVYLWLRGILDGSRSLARRHVVRAFAAGCVALVIFLLVAEISPGGRPAGTGGVIFLFFAMGMMALALSSLRSGRVSEMGPNGQLRLNRYWLGSTLTVILVLLLLGLSLSLLISPTTVAQMLAWAWDVLSQVLILLIKIISLILYPILFLLARLLASGLQRLFRSDANPLPQLEGPEDRQANNLFDEVIPFVEQLPDEWRWVALLFFILGIGLLFALVWRRLAAIKKGDIEETREMIFSRELLRAQLAQLWPGWLKGWRRADPAWISPFLSLAGESQTRRAIRERYQALLAAARQRGQPRARHQTPDEYEQTLAQALPGAPDALNVITGNYLQARYSREVPTPAQVEETGQAWERLQTMWMRKD